MHAHCPAAFTIESIHPYYSIQNGCGNFDNFESICALARQLVSVCVSLLKYCARVC